MTLDRRRILVGGGVGIGLVVAWGIWPRDYAADLPTAPGEHGFGAWLTIAEDGRVTVAVPQAEHGQGSWTALAQIVADELGAEWLTVAVAPAPLSPLHANPLGLDELLEGMPAAVPQALRDGIAAAPAPMLTAASSSIRMFEEPARAAAASARALLCMAAAARWDVAWTDCTATGGFVTHGSGKSVRRLRFAELAAAAAALTPPAVPPIGIGGAGALMGKELQRLDAPAKVDGAATFAGDVRLAGMVHAAIRQGPIGDATLVAVDLAAAQRIRGVLQVVRRPRWVAAVARTGWTAQRALDALAPRFAGTDGLIDDAALAAALDAALAGEGRRIAGEGDLPSFADPAAVIANYRVAAGVHAAIETPAATASFDGGQLQLWLATAAPMVARAAAARAAGLAEAAVVVHPMPIGGSFGGALEHDVAEQAAILAVALGRPVCLTWSRGEASLHDRYRPAAAARMAARLGANGAILGWRASIAAPATGAALLRRLAPWPEHLGLAIDPADRYAVGGAILPYRLPAWAVDHHPADTRIPTGHLRGGMHGPSCFFTECFLDELAQRSGSEPMSYRIGMLGGQPRLARCLSTAASLGGWEGGVPGSGQGIACHAFRGSHIAVLAEAHAGEGGRPVVDRLVAAVDCGRMVNPDLVRQQIEGGLVFGLAQALGASTAFVGGLATARGFDTLWLPRLADTPDITVELIRSDEAPGGVSELGVPAVAPAIANALFAATGTRLRSLPLGGAGR